MKKSFKRPSAIVFLIVLALMLLIFTGCQNSEPAPAPAPEHPGTNQQGTDGPTKLAEPVEQNDFILGTIISLKLFDFAEDAYFADSFDALRSIERRMTINDANPTESEVMQINQNAGIQPVKVSDDTFEVIKNGIRYSTISEGRFDLSVGVLVKLWNIGTEHAGIPPQAEIDSRLPLVDYSKIELNEAEKTVFLKEKGMLIDLGGIAKGFGADVVSGILYDYGVRSAIVNLGGNVLVMGEKPDGSPWRIGVQNPFSERGEYLGIATITDKTIVTSGIYERYFEKNGKRYHHILDTSNGYPVENGLAGVSIIADISMDADALSTAVFSLGAEKGKALVETIDGIDAIFVMQDYSITMTEGARSFFELTDNNFRIID
jgi:thiamine biosynthesis lipoprotein